MNKATYDIKFVRGDSYTLFGRQRMRVWDELEQAYVPGAYRDLTGYTGRAQMRQTLTSIPVVVTFAVTIGNQVTTPGSFFVTCVPADTEGLANSSLEGVWDLEWTSPTGVVSTPLGGTVKIEGDVSRD